MIRFLGQREWRSEMNWNHLILITVIGIWIRRRQMRAAVTLLMPMNFWDGKRKTDMGMFWDFEEEMRIH